MRMRRHAFTLIELLIVIAIIALLSTVVGVNYVESQKRSRDSARIASVGGITTAVEAFFSAQQRFPGVAPATNPSLPTSPCISPTVFTDGLTYPAYFYAGAGCQDSSFADGYWIPGLERYLGNSPRETRLILQGNPAPFLDPLLVTDQDNNPNTTQTLVYRPLQGGYMVYARLEAENPDASRSVDRLTLTNPTVPLSSTDLTALQAAGDHSLYVEKR